MVLNEHLDRAGGTPSPTHLFGSLQLSEIIEKRNLCDIWREQNKTKKEFTWQNPNKTIESRIDRFYIPTNFKKDSKQCNILPIIWNDHKYITIKITIKKKGKQAQTFGNLMLPS